MRRAATALVVGLLLAGCSGEDQAEAPTTAPSSEATSPSPSTSSSAPAPSTSATSASPVAGEVPPECEREPSTLDDTGPIGQAAGAVATPPGVVTMGTQLVTSTDVPGTTEVVVRPCSAGLAEADLIALAAAYAAAIDQSAEGDTVSLLKVSMWVPDGAGSIEQELSATTDRFALIQWDSPLATSPSSWEIL